MRTIFSRMAINAVAPMTIAMIVATMGQRSRRAGGRSRAAGRVASRLQNSSSPGASTGALDASAAISGGEARHEGRELSVMAISAPVVAVR